MRRLLTGRFLRAYAGASVELGNVWQDASDVSLADTIPAGSMLLGLDTPIGPVYLGYGRTENDDQSFYLYVGPQFQLWRAARRLLGALNGARMRRDESLTTS